MIRFISVLSAVFLATTATAQDDADIAAKFTVAGDTLIYDTENLSDAEIETDDIDHLLKLLRGNESIKTVELNSGGGSIYAGIEMARIIIDFELDTLVNGECASSCVRMFLGGHNRQMTLGSKIGFHQAQWSPRNIQGYYEDWAENEGWDTPFDFASWLYEDTQREFHEDLTFMIDRGVDAAFAAKAKGTPNADMWYPTRTELTLARVLRLQE